MGFGSASIFFLECIDYLATNSVRIKESFYFRAFVFKSVKIQQFQGGASDELAAGNIVVVLDDHVLAVHHHGNKTSTFLVVVWVLIVVCWW
jgi:hypothetical protein